MTPSSHDDNPVPYGGPETPSRRRLLAMGLGSTIGGAVLVASPAGADVELVSRDEIRAGIEQMQGNWDYFVQTAHPGSIRLGGDTAVGRAYILEFGHMRDGRSELNYSLYHDRYQRTSEGWKFAERVYEIRYLDTTPLAGPPLDAARAPASSPTENGPSGQAMRAGPACCMVVTASRASAPLSRCD